jgi:hypothetical protein
MERNIIIMLYVEYYLNDMIEIELPMSMYCIALFSFFIQVEI